MIVSEPHDRCTTAVVGSGILFGLGHLGWGRTIAAVTVVFGMAFALAFEWSGSLWVPVIIHAGMNSKIALVYAQRAGWLRRLEPQIESV